MAKRKSKKPTKKPRSPRLPRGFKPLPGSKRKPKGRKSRRSPAAVKRQIVTVMKGWRAKLASAFKGRLVFDILSAKNADGSVSCQFRIENIPKKTSIDTILLHLGAVMHGVDIPGAWFSVGFNLPGHVDVTSDLTYKKFQGGVQFRMHTRKLLAKIVPYLIQQARQNHERYRRLHRYRAHTVFVNVWWNPYGQRPKRRR